MYGKATSMPGAEKNQVRRIHIEFPQIYAKNNLRKGIKIHYPSFQALLIHTYLHAERFEREN